MKFLAWDTSSKAGVVVAVETDFRTSGSNQDQKPRIVSQFSLDVGATHSERLLWAVHQVLASARWKIEEVDVFAVGVGPGSFTGLRIGVTTARTLAHVLGKPLIPLSSLAALARSVSLLAAPQREQCLVIGATDACKGEIFSIWGDARNIQKCTVNDESQGPGLWSQSVVEAVLTPVQLSERLRAHLLSGGEQACWVAAGDAVSRYPEIWAHLPQDQRLLLSELTIEQIDGRVLGWMTFEAWRVLQSWNPLDVYPRYLRASDAEQKLKAGLLARAPVS